MVNSVLRIFVMIYRFEAQQFFLQGVSRSVEQSLGKNIKKMPKKKLLKIILLKIKKTLWTFIILMAII